MLEYGSGRAVGEHLVVPAIDDGRRRIAGLLHRIPGLALAAILALAMLPSTTVPVTAATFTFPGQTCPTMNGQSGSENDGNGATFNEYVFTVTLTPGQSLTIQTTALNVGLAQVSVIVDGMLVSNVPGASTTINYSSAAPVTVQIFVHETSFAITSSCGTTTPSTTPPLTNAELAAATRDALTQSLGGARPSSNPNSLPGSRDEPIGAADPCELFQRRVDDLVATRDSLEFETHALAVAEADLRKRPLSDFAGESVAEQQANRNAEQARLRNEQVRNTREVNENVASLAAARASLDACRESEGGGLADEDSGEFGDGDEVLFFPRPDSHVPWPIVASHGGIPAHAYAGTGLDTGSDRFFGIDGMPANFWTRVRGNYLDGTFGRTGFSGSLQAGLTVGVTDDVDLGVYAYLLTGRISSTPLSGELKTLAAALGAYVKKHLDNGVTLGLSGSQEFGSNDITLSGATGSFTSSLTTLDASVVFAPIRLDGFVLTPSAAMGWKHAVNGGYTDSTGLAVPSTANTTLAVTGALNVAYPMAIEHTHVATVTPRASVAGNLFLLPGSSLALTPGTLSPNRFTLDVSAGVSLGLVSGGTVDVVVTANGLLGQSQAYGVRAGLRVPL